MINMRKKSKFDRGVVTMRIGLAGTGILLISLALAVSSCEFIQGLFNKPPVAVIEAFPASGGVPLEATFDGTKSYDPDGIIKSYDWNLGDSQTAAQKVVIHNYRLPGDFLVTLAVVDNRGARAEAQITIHVFGLPMNELGS